MKRVFGIAALLALSAASATMAQEKPERAIRFRQGVYQVIGHYVGQMGQMVKGQRPFDRDAFVRDAAIVETMSRIVPEAFPPGSDKGKTRAKADIWRDADKFNAAVERFQSEAAKLHEVSKQGDADRIKSQFGALAKACDNCHDDFRSK